jgi:ligand-binding sensor domain-containing protein
MIDLINRNKLLFSLTCVLFNSRIFFVLFIYLLSLKSFAQNPHFFSYSDDNGMPSNEVYSILQDKSGFIWIGCDAGLFKYDGVRYTFYKCKTQQSKSISTLTLSPSSNQIYCVNFQDQLFYLENDTLKELKHFLCKISHITLDNNGFLYVTHKDGLSMYNPQTKMWRKRDEIKGFTSSIVINAQNEAYFLTEDGLAKSSNEKCVQMKLKELPNGISSNYLLFCYKKEAWIFRKTGGEFHIFDGEKIIKENRPNLRQVLQNRKITRLKYLSDKHLWLATYNGIIRYDIEKDYATVFYTDLPFSDFLKDREGNYWFSTLQAGLMRVPNLNFVVWNKKNEILKNDKITKLTHDNTFIYFTTGNGTIGKLHTKTNELKTFQTEYIADAQSLDYIESENRVYFNVNAQLYFLKENSIGKIPNTIASLKSIRKIEDDYFKLSSWDINVEGTDNYKITEGWCRELKYDSQNKTIWVASNNGLLKIEYKNKRWEHTHTFLKSTQILSLDFDENTDKLFILAFDGTFYSMSSNDRLTQETILNADIQANKLKVLGDNLYVSTNKGVWIYNNSLKKWNKINSLSGLISDNVFDLLILQNILWIATSKGLQKIPLDSDFNTPFAKLYLKTNRLKSRLNYDESLIFFPEVSLYNAEGYFEYAYRINQGNWLKLPATIEQIELQNLPIGNVKIELKVIDHLGRDSENTIEFKIYVNPPFWKKWWFILFISSLIIGFIYIIFKQRIQRLKQKQQKEIEHLKLENQLRLTQQSALKAQMNPHFIFNVLNSIKGYIYENDKRNASLYLSRFSDLIRKILELSSVPEIKLSEEIEMLNLYITLEAMLLDNNFEYKIISEESIQSEDISIPALLIQPLVENAFKHGLRHKEGHKKIKIVFSKLGGVLSVIVEDNGVGREVSTKINQEKKHQSFASNALKQRIELLNTEQSKTVGIEFVDLKDHLGNAMGTRVVLKIKIES